MLRISLLSKNVLTLDGTVIDEKVSDKAIALIAILVLREDQRMSRRALIDILWPESSDSAGKNNLRFNLWQLRKALGEEEGASLIGTDRDSCFIDPAYEYTCDICEILQEDVEASSDLERLKYLLSLFQQEYLSDRYFHGCVELNEDMIMRRYSLDHCQRNIYKRYTDLCFAQKRYCECRDALLAYMRLDPYDEEKLAQLLLVLMRLDEKREAWNQYQMFHTRMVADLGEEPLPETRAILKGFRTPIEQQKALELPFRCIPHLEFYWVTSILQAMISREVAIDHFLKEEEQRDLSVMQYRMEGEAKEMPPMERVVDIFVTLIINLSKTGVTVSLINEVPEYMSESCRAVLMLLKERCGDRIRIR